MNEIQLLFKEFQKEMNWEIRDRNFEQAMSSLLNNYMLLTTEISEVAEEFRKAFNMTKKLKNNGYSEEDAFNLSKKSIKEDLGKELADCLAYICKFANFFNIDLKESVYEKLKEIKNRENKDN